MSGWGSSAGGRRTHQFVTPAAPPAPDLDDDVWGEELPEEALQEAILLESQQYTGQSAQPAAGRTPGPADTHGQQLRPAAAAADGGVAEREPRALPSDFQRLQRDNTLLSDQLRTAKADIYSHQGKVSVLREELTRRCRELENCRLESSRQLQEQQLQLEQSTRALNRDLDAVRSELQFKNHELAEVTRQCRTLRHSPGRSASPPRKAARLDPAGRRRFITSSEFRKPEASEAVKEATGTQTDPDCHQTDVVSDEVPPCHLVTAVLLASGDAHWLGREAVSALAELARQAVFCPERAGGAADLVAAAAAARLAQFAACVERLQTASDADRRLCTLGSGRRRAAALLALLQEEAAAVTALAALLRLAQWGAPLPGRLTAYRPLVDLLPRLLRPVIAEGEVRNVLMMEYTATLLATMAIDSLPESLVQALEPVIHEVFNTKPPARLLSALLELLINTAGTGQISGLWCRARRPPPAQKHTGTCLVKKLSILFSERAAPSDPPAGPSYRLPASHSRHGSSGGPPASAAAAALRTELSPARPGPQTVAAPPAVESAAGCRWLRLVALVMSRPAALPALACCRGHLTLLVVQLLHSAVLDWQHGGGGDASATLHLLSALHRLADLDPAFSGSVSRERLRYLTTMETLGRCWRKMKLTTQHVGVLQELYKFEPGTFDGASQSPPA